MAGSATIGVLKAVLSADVSAFTASMATATADVKKLAEGLQKDLEPRQRAVNAAMRDFLGGTEIRKAQEYAQAIEKIGGVTLLTAADQQKVNRAVTEALDHYKALGQQAPANLVALEQATRKVETETLQADAAATKMWAGLKSAAGLIGVAFSATAVVGFVKHVFDAASEIHDMALTLGVSAEAAQRFKFAADQTGSSLDAVGRSIEFMNRTLSSGEKSTVAALADAGLRFEDIRNMKPEEAFAAIAEAIRQIPDPMRQAEVATRLFGKTGQELLPGIKEGFIEIGRGAKVMSDDTVNRLEAAQDALDKLKAHVTIFAGEMIGAFARDIPAAMNGFALALQDLAATAQNGLAGHRAFMEALAQSRNFEKNHHDIQLASEDVKGHTTQTKEEEAALKKAAEAAKAHAAALQKIADVLTGKELSARVKDLSAELTLAGQQGGITAFQYAKLRDSIEELVKEGARLPPNLQAIHEQTMAENAALSMMDEAVGSAAIGLQALRDAAGVTLPNLYAIELQLNKVVASSGNLLSQLSKQTPNLGPILTAQGKAAGIDHSVFANVFGSGLSEAIVRAVEGGGNVVAAAGSHIGETIGKNIAKESSDTIKQSLGKTLGGALLDAIPVIGSLLGPALSGLGKVFSKVFGFGSAGRDKVVDFATQFGGFDALQAKLATLGDEGEALWKKLTQGIGRNDAKGAQQAIDAITAALGRFDKEQADLHAHLDKDFSDLTSAVQKFGGVAPTQLQPMIAELIKMNGLTAEQKSLLEQLAGDPSLDSLQEAADRLGVKFEHMGAEFTQSKISESALQMVRDLDMLAEHGADMNGVLKDSADKINGLVQQAIASGASLPLTLKPYIDKLNEMGSLVGPDGLPLDISKITFADIPDQALSDIKGILEDIRDLLANKLPAAAQSAQRALDEMHGPDLTPTTGSPMTPPPEGAHTGDTYPGVDENGQYRTDIPVPPGYATGSGGMLNADPLGTYVKIHGQEEILTANQSAGVASMVRDALASASSGGSTTAQLVVDGRVLGEVIVPYIVAESRRLGLAGTF